MDRNELYLKLFAAFQGIQKRIVPKATALDEALPFSQRVLLFNVAIHGPTNIKYLSQVLHITSGAVTQSMNALIAAGYVTRDIDAHDKRNVVVSLSSEGRKLMRTVKQESLLVMHDLFVDITDEELTEFTRIFEKIGIGKGSR